MEDKNILGTESIGKLLLKFSVPGVISMLVNSIYNVVDQIFIGQGVGFLGNAATNVTMPFVTIMMALSLMVSVGTVANVGLNLGQGNKQEADHFVGNGFIISIIVGIVVLALGEIFLVPMLYFFGATQNVIPYAIPYARIVLIGFPFVCAGIQMNDIIKADGTPIFAMISMLTGALINIIFDPIFIFVFHWGVTGAAIATVMGQVATFVMSYIRIGKLKTLQMSARDFKPSGLRMKHIFLIGISPFLNQMAMFVSQIVANNQATHYGALSRYGEDIPLTCFGINGKVIGIMMSVIIGIASGTQPVFSFNYGAKKYRRVRELVFKTCFLTFFVGLFAWFFLQFTTQQIISIFGQEDALYNEFAVLCMKNMTFFIFVMGVPMLAGVYFQAVGKPLKAAILSLSRQFIFLIPMLIFMPLALGLYGVMYAYPLSDLASIIMAVAFLWVELRKLRELEKAL